MHILVLAVWATYVLLLEIHGELQIEFTKMGSHCLPTMPQIWSPVPGISKLAAITYLISISPHGDIFGLFQACFAIWDYFGLIYPKMSKNLKHKMPVERLETLGGPWRTLEDLQRPSRVLQGPPSCHRTSPSCHRTLPSRQSPQDGARSLRMRAS